MFKVKFFSFLILFSVNVKAPTALELFGNFKIEDFKPPENSEGVFNLPENSAGVFNIPSSISKFFSDSSKQEDTTTTVRNDDYTFFKYLVIFILDRKLKKMYVFITDIIYMI